MNFEAMKPILAGLVRHALTFFGGVEILTYMNDPYTPEVIVGAIMTLIGFGWSVIKNSKTD